MSMDIHIVAAATIIMITDMTTGAHIAAVTVTITIMSMAMNWCIIAAAINKPIQKQNIPWKSYYFFLSGINFRLSFNWQKCSFLI